jgi:hypothetical protein
MLVSEASAYTILMLLFASAMQCNVTNVCANARVRLCAYLYIFDHEVFTTCYSLVVNLHDCFPFERYARS